jgi:hypothetical protein
MGVQAFTKTGNCVAFLANTTAPTPIQAVSSTLGGNQYRIINASSSVTVFLGYGTSASDASNNAVVVTAGNTAPGIPLLPGTDEILSFVPNAYFTGTTSSSTATVYIIPGDGL